MHQMTPPVEHEGLHLQTLLLELNRFRLRPALSSALSLERECELRRLEETFLEARRASIAERAAQAPRDAEKFVAWFEQLKIDGPGQGDVLFPWLAEKATYEQMRWFLKQEVAGEAGFEDLLAITQVRFSKKAKLEMARNYWDELGNGNDERMHGPLLERISKVFDLDNLDVPLVVESLELGNIMVALASNRKWAYQSIGALGVIELTAPGRAKYVALGLRRLGLSNAERRYFSLHATLDVKHSEAWNREVLIDLLTETPAAATAIAEGALLRLQAGAACFAHYRREFGFGPNQPHFSNKARSPFSNRSPISIR